MKKLVVLTLILFVNLSFSQDLKFGKEVFQAKFKIPLAMMVLPSVA